MQHFRTLNALLTDDHAAALIETLQEIIIPILHGGDQMLPNNSLTKVGLCL